jgi:hypothetical protein
VRACSNIEHICRPSAEFQRIVRDLSTIGKSLNLKPKISTKTQNFNHAMRDAPTGDTVVISCTKESIKFSVSVRTACDV